MERLSYFKSVNSSYIDEMWERYVQDSNSVDVTWKFFFEGIELGHELSQEGVADALSDEAKVAELINAYRESGRLIAKIDPLSKPLATHPLLGLSRFGLSEEDLDREFQAGYLLGLGPCKLSDILNVLHATYCGTIAVQFTHITRADERFWLQQRMESCANQPKLDAETKQFILRRLIESESFERFLHTRYVAQKRFSVEGGEAFISSLDAMIEGAGETGASEIALGMAHRGRLNVLVNVFGKKPEYVFTEFEGNYSVDTSAGEGDVKYHLGYSSDFKTRMGHTLHLSLASNPSHLEQVNPVVEGVVRAKQTLLGDQGRNKVIPILVHGDAAFAGQGVCYETLNLAGLKGYTTGGTLHIVVNNQIGFTANPSDSRSTLYATDLAKMLEVPIFHVNGDDPEAVWYVSKLCVEYRQKFNQDCFIDIICYRRYGHNEGDEPLFTQPVLYKQIKSHPTAPQVYATSLGDEGKLLSDQFTQQVMDRFSAAQVIAKKDAPHPPTSAFEGQWKGLRSAKESDLTKRVDTRVSAEELRALSERLNRMPEGFHLNPKLTRFFELRLKAVQEGTPIDWGNAETLAYATLLKEKTAVRLSGQDAERGTFTHRHSVLKDFETSESYTPLNSLGGKQALFEVYNSHLSEAGVLGFEYGYSLADPMSLVIWEAQFGDFANGAQIMIDQFLSTSESKWNRHSGLVLLLPHGQEGQGPEHSSARLERFLQLSGKNNWSICNLTTPAQIFHALRRQVKRDFRKPLVVMSPKSLLRHPRAISHIDEFSKGYFGEVLDDGLFADEGARSVKRVLLCSGKIYYDLLLERESLQREDVALVRVEQLYPWPKVELARVLSRYPKAKDLIWVQEEAMNMGAWPFVHALWSGGLGDFSKEVGGRGIQYLGREWSASPAVGSAKVHDKEQKRIVKVAYET